MAEKNIGAKITLSGEKEYRNALNDIKLAQAQLRSETKLLATQYKDTQNTLEALEKKNEVLTKQYDLSAEKVEVCKKAVADYTKKQGEATDKIGKLEDKYKAEHDVLEDLKKVYGESSEEVKKQETVVAGLGNEIEKAKADYQSATVNVSKWTAALNYATEENVRLDHELKTNEKYIDEAKHSINQTAVSIDEYGQEVEEAKEQTSRFGETLSANLTSQVIIAGVKALASAIAEISEACIESGEAFEAAMSNVEALSGATSEELEILNKTARSAGENTVFSASEAADALGYMALAGWKTQEMAAGLEPVLNLAAAANTDLARTSDIVTDYLTAFGLTAQDASKFTDQMAYAMANSNTNVEQLGEAYKSCAATAHSMGVSVEEVTAVLATMANAGVKGGEAGTALNTIMTRLATNTKECADELSGYGVEVYDAYGNMNSLSSILAGMSEIWDDLTDIEQANLAKTIAGTNQYSKLQTIMNGLSEEVKQGGKSFEDYKNALENCDGTAQKMADTMQDNLKGKLKTLESAMESLKISTYEVFDDNLKDGVDGATAAVKRLNNSVTNGSLNVSLNKLSKSVGEFTEKSLELGEKALPGTIEGFAWILDHAGLIVTGVGTIVAAQTAYKVAVEASTVAQTIQNAVMMANPAGLLAAGIVALTGAVIALEVATDRQTKEYDEEYKEIHKLIDANKDLNDSIQQTSEARRKSKEANEADASIAKNLIEELKRLQAGADRSTESLTKQRMIVDELNQIFPELNLAINDQTGELNMSTAALDKNVDALIKQAKAEAAREDLVAIAKEQYEADKQLYELQQKRAEEQVKWNEIVKQSEEEIKKLGRVTDDTQVSAAMIDLTMEDLDTQIKETQQSVSELSDEYERTKTYLGDTEAVDTATGAIAGCGNAAENAGKQISGMTLEAQQALEEMYESVSSTVSQQMDIFEKFSEKTAISKDEILENMQSQIDGITLWADNLESLSERGIDQGLLKHLAEMGPAGAAYVAAFTEMTDEELQKASEKFEEAMSLPDDVAAKMTDAYREAGVNAVKATATGIQDNSNVLRDVTEKTAERLPDIFDEKLQIANGGSGIMKQKGEAVSNGLSEGISNKSVDAVAATDDMVTQVINEAETLNQYDWSGIGKNMTTSLADSIREGTSDVTNAIAEMCSAAVSTAQEELEIHSPSKKFEWLGEMSAKGYNGGLEKNLVNPGTMIAAILPKDTQETSGAWGQGGLDELRRIYSAGAEYIARSLQNIQVDVNNTVTIEGEFNRFLRAMIAQNDKEVYRTKTNRL